MSGESRVAFYVLQAEAPGSRQHYACRLVEKVYKLTHRVHVHVADEHELRQLDELLWTFRQGSFVPHEILTMGQPHAAPVTLGLGSAAPPMNADLLINLADEVPGFYRGFGRIAEIVDGSARCRELGRIRHRFYRQEGLEPATHEVA